MANVLGSFAQGVNIGKGLIDIANNREDRARAKEEYEHSKERRGIAEKRQDQSWDWRVEDRQNSLEDREQQKKEHKEDRDWNKVVRDREKVNWAHQDEKYKQGNALFAMKVEEHNYQKRQRANKEQYQNVYLPAIQRYMVNGDDSGFQTDDFQHFINRNPSLNPYNMVQPEYKDALGKASSVIKRVANGEQIEPHDPELLGAVNTLYSEVTQSNELPTIYTDKDNKKHEIIGRKIVGLHPMDNGRFALQQEITLQDGKKVNVPVTMNRSSDPDDPVMTVTLKDLTDRVSSSIKAHSLMSQTQVSNLAYLQGQKTLRGGTFSDQKTKAGLLKQQMVEVNKINNEYDKSRNDILSMGDPNDEGVQAKLRMNEQNRQEAIDRAEQTFSNMTGIRSGNSSRKERVSAADKVVDSVINQNFSDYDLPRDKVAKVKKYYSEHPNMSQDDIKNLIGYMDAPKKQPKGGENGGSNLDKLSQQILAENTTEQQPTEQNDNTGDVGNVGKAGGSGLSDRSVVPAEKQEEINRLKQSDVYQQASDQEKQDMIKNILTKKKYGGEVGTMLPGYQEGEGLMNYGKRQFNSFADKANTLQDRLTVK